MSRKSEFEAVAMIHLDAVYKTAIALCGHKDLAEDLTQTTLLKAYENFSSFKKDTNCRAWLIRILRNTWIDHLRRQRFQPQQLEDDITAEKPAAAETSWTNARDMLDNFSDEQVIKALNKLPDDQRLTLYLVDVEGLSHDDVAQIMEIAVGTVKSRTSRARAELKDILASYAQQMRLTGGKK